MKKLFSFRLIPLVLTTAGLTIATTIQCGSAYAAEDKKGTPIIQFETNFFDFGKINNGEAVYGVFKFKNAGDAVLKVEPPLASCDCTDPRVKPDTLAPGASGEILYSIKLERAITGQRFITVHSNDPKTPSVKLTAQLDYTPLYDFDPKSVMLVLPAGKDEVQKKILVTRFDGQPLEIDRLTASKDWVSAAFSPSSKPQEGSAEINITLHRPPGPPAPFTALVRLWSSNYPAQPMQTLQISGEVLGELAASPQRIYWVIPDFGKDKAAYPAESLMKKIELRSVLGHEVDIKNVASSIKDMTVQIIPTEPHKKFDLLLKFDELPKAFANGTVTVETSLASLPKIEIPVTVAVPE
jgi:hypothetical protein